MSELWKNKNYLSDIPYLISHHIYEYDMTKANINVLLWLGEIDKDYYDKLKAMPRQDRQVEIGYLLKYNAGLQDKLSDGIQHFRKLLFEENDLEDIDILAIKNDAVYVISKKLSNTKFDNVEFVLKNHYTTYIRLARHIEVYFESNIIEGTVQLDIKGISDIKLELHHKYMATILADVIYYIETGDINSGLTYLSDIYNKYIDKQLDPGYYRNFDTESCYTIVANGSYYSVPYCNSKEMFMSLDISCNLDILRTLYGYLTNIYFSRR